MPHGQAREAALGQAREAAPVQGREAAPLYPMLQAPAFKDYIWGGARLATEYGKRAPRLPIAESWELSCHPDGPSSIANGPLAGMPLPDALARWPLMAGTRAKLGRPSDFPVLVKLIDAKEDLSLQVHPDDGYARLHENSFGKNEVWYVVDCKPGSKLALGLRQPVPPELARGAPGRRDGLLSRIRDGSILGLTRFVEARPGDCFCVRAGLLHAICSGILVAEIQQSSNITYRVHDYGRLGADGEPRPLHFGQAADVIDAELAAENTRGGIGIKQPVSGWPPHATETQLTDWPYFRTRLLTLAGTGPGAAADTGPGAAAGTGAGAGSGEGPVGAACARLDAAPESFHSILALDSGLQIHCGALATPLSLSKGDSMFIPAGMGPYDVVGAGRALLTDI